MSIAPKFANISESIGIEESIKHASHIHDQENFKLLYGQDFFDIQ